MITFEKLISSILNVPLNKVEIITGSLEKEPPDYEIINYIKERYAISDKYKWSNSDEKDLISKIKQELENEGLPHTEVSLTPRAEEEIVVIKLIGAKDSSEIGKNPTSNSSNILLLLAVLGISYFILKKKTVLALPPMELNWAPGDPRFDMSYDKSPGSLLKSMAGRAW